jgi:hypothetical protein
MDPNDTNPSANVPAASAAGPRGDRGRGDKTWTPPPGEQGISNRVMDEDTDATEAPAAGQPVERGGEVKPDRAEKGSERDDARHEGGIPDERGPA